MTSTSGALEAFKADSLTLRASPRAAALSGHWHFVSHVLSRLGELPLDKRDAFLQRAVAALDAVDPGLSGEQDAEGSDASDLALGSRRLREALDAMRRRKHGAPSQLADAVQPMVARQEELAAFQIALATLLALRSALHPLDPPLEGRLLAQQGRVLRQGGELSAAAQVYSHAARLGRTSGDADVEIRATIGAGVVANMRGNYPQARACFRRAIRVATGEGHAAHVAAAHQGLLAAAVAACDSGTALRHGWSAFHQAEGKPDQQAEALTSLAQVAASAGEYGAALNGFLMAEQLTDLVRIQLPALGGAAVAAAHRLDAALVAALESRAFSVIARSHQPFEDAKVLVELAEARLLLGETEGAEALLARATALAHEKGFYEILHHTARLTAGALSQPSARQSLSARSQRIIRSLEGLASRSHAKAVAD